MLKSLDDKGTGSHYHQAICW
uniref:Uncharacterized protein n=1 Tax=Anguilla anguilla TaxID=7936 RepID=A0A0E9VGS9_ANGAN